MNPKVLVGCPTSHHKEYCLKEFADSVKSLTYDNYDILLVDNSEDDIYLKKIQDLGIPVVKSEFSQKARDRIINGRNMLRQKALDDGYDYFFSLEQDVIPPEDIIERLLSHKKKVISGVYFLLKPEYGFGKNVLTPLLFTNDGFEDEVRYMKFEEVRENKLIEIHGAGLGCILIHRDVLKSIVFHYDQSKPAFDDMWFAKDCADKSIKMWCDTSLKCRHLVLNKSQKDLWENIEK